MRKESRQPGSLRERRERSCAKTSNPSVPVERTRAKLRERFLILGYGNRLRGDDGVGPMVAESISDLQLPGVKAIACDLLTPELADPISQAANIIFVDAALTAPRQVELRAIEVADSSQIMAHAAEPGTLLALARDVFGHAPKAWLLTIPVDRLEIGEPFSRTARRGLHTAIRMVRNAVMTGRNTHTLASCRREPKT